MVTPHENSPDVFSQHCSSRAAFNLLSSKWAALIVRCLQPGPQRFSAIHRRIQGVSQKVLTQSLRHLEDHGLVLRTVVATRPLHVTYELTDLGSTLIEPIDALVEWSQTYGTSLIAHPSRPPQKQTSGSRPWAKNDDRAEAIDNTETAHNNTAVNA